jgi:hypothetical protein
MKYKIQNSDGTFLNNGTGLNSWLTLDEARKLVNYNIGQRIVEHNGVDILWEIF